VSFDKQKTRETAMVYDTCDFTSFFAEITSLKSTFGGEITSHVSWVNGFQVYIDPWLIGFETLS